MRITKGMFKLHYLIELQALAPIDSRTQVCYRAARYLS